MDDHEKSTRQLIEELSTLRRHITELEARSHQPRQPGLEIDGFQTEMEPSMVGREVSCRALKALFVALQKKDLAPELLTNGLSRSFTR